jgi:hypothetical protein
MPSLAVAEDKRSLTMPSGIVLKLFGPLSPDTADVVEPSMTTQLGESNYRLRVDPGDKWPRLTACLHAEAAPLRISCDWDCWVDDEDDEDQDAPLGHTMDLGGDGLDFFPGGAPDFDAPDFGGMPQDVDEDEDAGDEDDGVEDAGDEDAGVEADGVEDDGVEVAGVEDAGDEDDGDEVAGVEVAGDEVAGVEVGGVEVAGDEVAGVEVDGVEDDGVDGYVGDGNIADEGNKGADNGDENAYNVEDADADIEDAVRGDNVDDDTATCTATF